MYELADRVPYAELPPGTNLLLTGPAMTEKRRLALELLAGDDDEGAVAVTTTEGAGAVINGYRKVTDGSGGALTVVDCVTRQRGGELLDDDRVTYARSPVDLTDVGIKLSEALDTLHADRGIERNRVLLYSLTTLLTYADLETVFRFMHVLTNRIEDVDALGVYAVDETAHDEQTLHTLRQLFDCELRVDEDGELHTRLRDRETGEPDR